MISFAKIIPHGMALFTLGYEGFSIDEFIARLTACGVRQVIDVRELPLSRKRGFSKKMFGEALQQAGFAYRHLAEFGCPRPIRNRYKVDQNWPAYVKAFDSHLAVQNEAVVELGRLAWGTTACLVCFEADFDRCHRSLVGRACYKAGGPPMLHLTAKGVVADEADRRAA